MFDKESAIKEVDKLYRDGGVYPAAIIQAAITRIEQLENAKSEWQPIETAPKDGTLIIAWPCWSSNGVDMVQWHKGRPDCWRTFWASMRVAIQPTHWMPLPLPPNRNRL